MFGPPGIEEPISSAEADSDSLKVVNSLGIKQPIRRAEIDGFILTEQLHQPSQILATHEHGAAIISLVLKGHVVESIGRHSFECDPYSLQVLPAGEPHSFKFNHFRVNCLTIEVKPQRLETIRRSSNILDRPRHIDGGMLAVLILKLHREFRATDSTSALTIEGLILETLGVSAREKVRCQSSTPPTWLRQARDFIHGDFREKISLTTVANFVEVHPAHLARTFRKNYGCSIGDYVRNLRLGQAGQELACTNKSLAEIAAAAGFYDQSHFAHAFKLQTRMTPAEYRVAGRTKQR